MFSTGFEPSTFVAPIIMRVTTQPFGHKDLQTIRNEVPTVSRGWPRHPKQIQTAPTLLSTQPATTTTTTTTTTTQQQRPPPQRQRQRAGQQRQRQRRDNDSGATTTTERDNRRRGG